MNDHGDRVIVAFGYSRHLLRETSAALSFPPSMKSEEAQRTCSTSISAVDVYVRPDAQLFAERKATMMSCRGVRRKTPSASAVTV